MLAVEAVRLAARYAAPGDLAEPRRILAAAPALASDPVAHAKNELELYRALVTASGIWPAVWMANAFWAPMGQVYARLAPIIGQVPPRYQQAMERLIDRVAARDESGAEDHLRRWLAVVDARLLRDVERVLAGDRSRKRDEPARADEGEVTI
jgi:DNA-binding FadR family transcriptional regulator